MDTLRDKNGKTEQEFLREYDVTRYFRPSVTVDALLYKPNADGSITLLMIKRGGHPYLGLYAFPGGFVDKDEPCEVAAYRELMEETGLSDVYMHQLITVSTPRRDPRWRNITVVFCGELKSLPKAEAGDDAADAKWFNISISGNSIKFVADGVDFTVTLDVVRDKFGDVDLNNTKIVDRALSAFDHAKVAYLLIDRLHRGVM